MADELSPDWRKLAPHRPLPPGAASYVARPSSGGDAIASWILAGGSTVLVSGPTGVGKSTELAQATKALKSARVASLVQVDRHANMHQLEAAGLQGLVARELVAQAKRLGLPISNDLAIAVGIAERGTRQVAPLSGSSAVDAAVAEITRVSQQGRVALVLDGLEKLLPGRTSRDIFESLAQLPESVDLVVVIPWHAAFAGGTEPIVRAGERLHRVAVLDTEGDVAGAEDFFRRVLLGRLRVAALPDSVAPLVGRASKASGGIPRVFLQLMADAGTYARLKRNADWPDAQDLDEAIVDQQDSFRRALLPGDTQAIQAVAGTDGRELDLERRVRLMAQGILIERIRDKRRTLWVHPLLLNVMNP